MLSGLFVELIWKEILMFQQNKTEMELTPQDEMVVDTSSHIQ